MMSLNNKKGIPDWILGIADAPDEHLQPDFCLDTTDLLPYNNGLLRLSEITPLVHRKCGHCGAFNDYSERKLRILIKTGFLNAYTKFGSKHEASQPLYVDADEVVEAINKLERIKRRRNG